MTAHYFTKAIYILLQGGLFHDKVICRHILRKFIGQFNEFQPLVGLYRKEFTFIKLLGSNLSYLCELSGQFYDHIAEFTFDSLVFQIYLNALTHEKLISIVSNEIGHKLGNSGL